MRHLLLLLALAPLAFAHSTHRTHIVDTDGDFQFELIRDDHGKSWAALTRDGVRYVTTDASVMAQLDKARERDVEISRAHAELGRRHAELGREHAQLGREHARARTEDEHRALEEQQRRLEERQRRLEDEQRELEAKQKATEGSVRRAIEQIFEQAVRDGKARRD